jgi:hypothetical protein
MSRAGSHCFDCYSAPLPLGGRMPNCSAPMSAVIADFKSNSRNGL